MYIDRNLAEANFFESSLEKRYYSYYCYDDDCNSGWYTYGRWVLLGVLVAVAIIALLLIRWYSSKKVRHGEHPLPMTGWMVPPSYYQSQQQYNQPTTNDGPPVPTYNQQPGAQDAGYYDSSGNFISKQENDDFPPAHMRPDNTGNTDIPQGDAADYYRPPAGPPLGTDTNYSPPPGPPPAATR